MHILNIIDTLDPTAGGPSDSIRHIVASYPVMGHTGEVVSLDDPDAPFLRELGFTVHALGPRGSTYGANMRLIPWLRKNRHRFDGVVSHGLWTFTGFATWRVFSGKVPYVVFSHGMLDPYFKHAFPMKHFKKWCYWLAAQYWIMRSAYRVLFTSTAEAELAVQSFWLHNWNAQVVPYGASGPSGDPVAYKKAFFTHYPALLDADGGIKPYLLFLGRIHPKKGCDLLVNAFAAVADRAPDLQLVFAGPDQIGWRAELEAMATAAGIADRVHWPGMLQDELKWGAYYGCEVFVLPSHQENFGITVAEALACGKPVLLADKVNIAGDVVDAGAAYVEEDTAEGTLSLLNRWLDTSLAERHRMGVNALACFHYHYDMNENAKAIVNIFEHAPRTAPR